MTAERFSLDHLDENAVIRAILEGTASATGEAFFKALVHNLARALDTCGAWVTEYIEDKRRLRALAFWLGDDWLPSWEGDIAGTPCEKVIEERRLIHCADDLIDLYPGDPELRELGAVSYMGVPLLDADGRVLGHLAVLDTRPMPEEPKAFALFRIFAARAAAELQRLRAESAVRECEEELRSLVSSAMDGIVQLDRDLRVIRVNPAAEKMFGLLSDGFLGRPLQRFLGPESYARLVGLIEQLPELPPEQRCLWLSTGLEARAYDGSAFPAEATASSFELHRRTYYTLIVRNIDERLDAERRIASLTAEAEYLRQELRELHASEILGQSKPMRRVMQDVEEVAGTDATVLIYGETGTGKELLARAIHNASPRRTKPLIRVNCAALPANLIESEFFGHEKGAFTGATARREGRFALADGGTIFLDEIGELPVDLQAKLLRVLQEGEFEPVGSSHTRRVNVRVLAATNRDLTKAVEKGEFRQDLFYRLNVFPIVLPPLRERGSDIALLAQSFARRCARRMGRIIEPLTEQDLARLTAYDWPGNVRELENVIERAIITARGGRIDLDRALPPAASPPLETLASTAGVSIGRVLTVRELEELERANIVCALERAGWRVAGGQGAAALLGMNPSTLNSRIKALGITRSR